jgi:hypothetical protein
MTASRAVPRDAHASRGDREQAKAFVDLLNPLLDEVERLRRSRRYRTSLTFATRCDNEANRLIAMLDALREQFPGCAESDYDGSPELSLVEDGHGNVAGLH